MENESQLKHELSTKRRPELKECMVNNESKEEKVKLNENANMKKMRRQLCKKLDINIDEKHREYAQVLGCVKTPIDRKISKSNKSSKGKLKREEDKENSDSKSSKKKIIHR